MNKRIVFFPYHPDIDVVVNYAKMMQGFEIVGIISYLEDVNKITTLNRKLGICCDTDDDILRNADAIFLLENYRSYTEGRYFAVLDKAIQMGLEIYVMPVVKNQIDLSNYEGKYKIIGNVHECAREYNVDATVRRELGKENMLEEIEIPIVAISGMGKNCGKFETLLLTQMELKTNYNVVAVSSNALGVLFGFYTYPDSLYENISFEHKVLQINYYMKSLSNVEDTEAIVLSIPEGVAPFRGNESNHFGEYAYIITMALPVDLMILCVYFILGNLEENGLNAIAELIGARFGIKIDAVVMSMTLFDVESGQKNDVIYEFLDKDVVDACYKMPKESEIPIINLHRSDDALRVIRQCFYRLENNISTI